MKKALSLGLCVVLLLSLVACGAESETETTTAGTVSEAEIVEEEVTEEVTEAEEEPAEPIEYDYSIVGDCYTLLTSCEPLLESTAEFQVSWWDIVGSEGEDIESQFVYALGVSGSEDLMNQAMELFPNMIAKYEASEYDPEMLELLTACVNEYYAINDLVACPSGTFEDYQATWDAEIEAYITAYDDMVAYLYDVGYFSDEE